MTVCYSLIFWNRIYCYLELGDIDVEFQFAIHDIFNLLLVLVLKPSPNEKQIHCNISGHLILHLHFITHIYRTI